MTPERWEQIKQVLNAALARETNARAAFLDDACTGDDELRREVESLLAEHDHPPDSFIDRPVFEAAADLFVVDEFPSVIGRAIGPYKIISQIGRGGMGEVYLAHDRRLGRRVALKLLPSRFTTDEDRLRRFKQEARAASALNHPNIITIHEVGQLDAAHFIATEFVEGCTLRSAIESGKLKLDDALDVAIQVASALRAAHEAGIVHRDIKPENIMLRPDGYVKVVDFGLAKLSERQTLADESGAGFIAVDTTPGVLMGTVTYMSPEQARGLAVDARGDIFSLGVVLYEVLAGRPPFQGATMSDLIVAILEKEPPALLSFAAGVPAELEAVINKALRKSADDRYQTAQDLLDDLRKLKQDAEIQARIESGPAEEFLAGVRTMASGEQASAQSTAGIANRTSSTPGIGRDSEDGHRLKTMAVLPFKTLAGNEASEHLGLGLADALITRLTNITQLRVRPTSAIAKYIGPGQDPIVAGRDLRVESVLEGSIRRLDDRIRVTVQLVSVSDEASLWAGKFDQQFTDIFAVEDSISNQVALALIAKLSSSEKELLSRRYTENIEAYELFLKGVYAANKHAAESIRQAIEYFNRAIERDPSYALAYAWLARCHNLLYIYGVCPSKENGPMAKAAAMRALELDDMLAEAHFVSGLVTLFYGWDCVNAERECKRAIELNPNLAIAHQGYGWCLTSQGRFKEAIAEQEIAHGFDPFSAAAITYAGHACFYGRRYDEAIAFYRKALEINPEFHPAHEFLGRTYAQKKMYSEAIVELRKAADLGKENITIKAGLANALARSGEIKEARNIASHLEALSRTGYVSSYDMAILYAGLDEIDEAFGWLEKAYQERYAWLIFLNVDPRLDGLRSDARFQDLLQRGPS